MTVANESFFGELVAADRDRQRDLLRDWFLARYADPAEVCPHDSREGGYQWIWGGPDTADDILLDQFDGIVPVEVLEELISRLDDDGPYWSPNPDHHPEWFDDFWPLSKSDTDPPAELVDVVRLASAELVSYLQKHPEELARIRPRQFEELIAEILKSHGWQVQLTPESRDGGYDLFAVSKVAGGVETAWIIECKKYRKDRKVGVDVVRSLFGVKSELQVANAMLATTSHFTKGVHDYKASRYDLSLRDYEGVIEWINQYKPNPNGRILVRDNKLILPGRSE